jgi:hypothetical protein
MKTWCVDGGREICEDEINVLGQAWLAFHMDELHETGLTSYQAHGPGVLVVYADFINPDGWSSQPGDFQYQYQLPDVWFRRGNPAAYRWSREQLNSYDPTAEVFVFVCTQADAGGVWFGCRLQRVGIERADLMRAEMMLVVEAWKKGEHTQ